MRDASMWTPFPDTDAIRFSLQATFLLSSRTSGWQQQEPWIALVAQGIERLPPEQKVVGSNPIEGTEKPPPLGKARGFLRPALLPGANVHLWPCWRPPSLWDRPRSGATLALGVLVAVVGVVARD